MSDVTGLVEQQRRTGWGKWSAGRVLRDSLFTQITPVLHMSDCIEDTSVRLVIQAYCLDLVSSLEEVIQHYELDRYPASVEV